MKAVLTASVVAAILAFGVATDAAPPAVGTLDLGPPVFTGQTVRMDLLLTFESGNPADTIELIEPSVYGSDLGWGPLLNPLDPAFGRFGFGLGPDLTTRNWQEQDPMGGGLFLFLEMVAMDPAAPLPLAPGSTYDVGTLLLDLTGIPAGSPVTVTLTEGILPLTYTDLAGTVDGVATSFAPGTNNDDTDPAWLVFADPDGVTFSAPGGPPDGEPVPEPDLLSTFTALVTLSVLDSLEQINLPAVGRFVRAMATPDGGFRACRSDPETDVEYTYYGLGTAAVLRHFVAGNLMPSV